MSKNKIVCIVVFWLGIYNVHGDFTDQGYLAASNAQGAKNLADNAIMIEKQTEFVTLMSQMHDQMEKLKKSLEDIEYVEKMQFVSQIMNLMNVAVCMVPNLTSMMTKSGGYNNCFLNFQYEYAMINLQGAINYMEAVMNAAVPLDGTGRLASIRDGMHMYTKGLDEMKALENTLTHFQFSTKIRNSGTDLAHASAHMSLKFN